MADSQYTFDTQPNSYFMGQDLQVTDGTGHTIIVNIKDDMWAVNVKDDATVDSFPPDVLRAFNRLNETTIQRIYDDTVREYWDWASDRVGAYDFGGICQLGREGGWLAVEGSTHMFPEMIEPDSAEAREARDRFLAFAFEVERAIEDDWRPQYFDALKAEAGKPETRHDLYIDDGRDEGSIGDAGSWERNMRTKKLIDAVTQHLRRDTDGDETRIQVQTYFIGGDEFLNREIAFGDDSMWTEFDLKPFRSDSDTGEPPAHVVPLSRVADKAQFSDAEGEYFWKIADGPVQGAVVVSDGRRYQQWDCNTLVRELV